MNFEIELPGNSHFAALRLAGIDANEYELLWSRFSAEPFSLPVDLICPYTLSAKPVDVHIAVLRFASVKAEGKLRIAVDDDAIGAAIQEKMVRYAATWRGVGIDAPEHKQVWAGIEEILERNGVPLRKLQRKEAMLTRRVMESLMELCDQTKPKWRHNVHDLFFHPWIAKRDNIFAAHWLIKQFEIEESPHEQIGVRIWDLADRSIADDLIRLIQEPRFGARRGVLCLALAKAKHPQAAEVIASVLDEKGMTRWALEALGKTKAISQIETIRQYLRNPDAEIRREAKTTLKKLGFPVETPPPPVHLVKNRRTLPKGLEEWSANLDIEELNPTLEALAKCIENGFSKQEIAEINGIVGEMKHNQTKTFCFPINAEGQKSEAWVEIFMDDIDSPDLAIYARPKLIRKLNGLLPERE